MTRTPLSSGGTAHSLGARLYTPRYGKPRMRFLSVVRPVPSTMRSERIEGYAWGPYVALGRSSVTEHGMAYGARALGARSASSTRGGHVPPGRTGEPCTGGSGTGGRMARSCEGREMRSAEAGLAIVRAMLGQATGELIDTETVTISSEGGRWKRAAGHLAGGLPYGTHGFEAETGGAIPSSTVTRRPEAYAPASLRLPGAAHRQR